MLRKTFAVVDLSKIAHNIRVLQKNMGEGVLPMAVVKANAYGHGVEQVAKTAQDCGVRWFAVATADEAVTLRESCEAHILVLSPADEQSSIELVKRGISVTAFTPEHLRSLSAIAKELKMQAKIHVKLDTGLGRIGLRTQEELLEVLSYFDEYPDQLKLEGLFTHFAVADQIEKSFTVLQLNRYLAFRDTVFGRGYRPICHASNSAAILDMPDARLDLCRMGISMYGYPPSGELAPFAEELQPALSLKSTVVHVKKIEPGDSVSYGRTFIADQPREIATVVIGYADGYPRALSNKGRAVVRGQSVRLAGRVCMDQAMFDVTGLGVQVGDEITLIGQDGAESIWAQEAAQLCENGMISYEILTGISARVPRVYIETDCK